MKQNEIAARQNRVVYTLLVVLAALGLAWAIWKHWYNAEAAPAPHVSSRVVAEPRGWALSPPALTWPGGRA